MATIWTQADLDKIDAAIAAGGALQRLRFADTEIEFRSVAEMMQVRATIAAALAAAQGPYNKHRLAATSKGV